MRKAIIITVLFLTALATASAQRTVYGTFTVGANYFYTLSSHGGAVNGGFNLNFGYADAGISGTLRDHTIGADGTAQSIQIMFNGGYMFRIAATRDRRFGFYLGGGFLLGDEILRIDKATMTLISSMGSNEIQMKKFQAGVYPKATLEWYFNNSFAMELIARAPVLFMSQVRTVFFEGGLGFKYNF